MRGSKKFGFTLIELLVVVAIIGILAAIALPKLFGAICQAKKGAVDASIGSINSAMSMYYGDNLSYIKCATPVALSGATGFTTTYMTTAPTTPWKYQFSYAGAEEGYTICAGVAAATNGCDGSSASGDEYRYYSTTLGKIATASAAPITGCQ